MSNCIVKRSKLLLVLLVCALFSLSLAGCKPSARTYRQHFSHYAEEYGVEPSWLVAIARAESGFDPQAVSSAGAKGVMQLLPSTAKWIAEQNGWEYEEDLLFDPTYNIRSGAWYVKYLNAKFEGDWWIAAYNAGEGRVTAWLDAGLEYKDIPYEETRTYLRRVKQFRRSYVFWGYDR